LSASIIFYFKQFTANDNPDKVTDIVVEVPGSLEGFELSLSLMRARGTLILK
jgi:hypothetical protein